MVARSRIDKLEVQIDQLHADRIIPPLVAHLRTLSTEQLRELERKLTKESSHD